MTRCPGPFFISSVFVLMALGSTLVAADSEVTGVFKGNGKQAKLAFVSAHKGATLADKKTTLLVLTEKDHAKEKRPEIKAAAGDFGSALIMAVHPDGNIVGCEVAHQAHLNKPFSSIGPIKMTEFRNEGGQIRGKVSTNGKAETFQQSWEVDLTFKTKAP